MNGAAGREKYPIFPACPPGELVPRGYVVKVALLWLGFIGIFVGIAGTGGPFAFLLPISLGVFIVTLTTMIWARASEKPLWMYKEARDDFQKRRYKKAQKKLESLIKLRPDLECKLLGALMICRKRTGDIKGAGDCCGKLLESGRIDENTNPDLLMEILHALTVESGGESMGKRAEKMSGDLLIETLKKYCV